MNDRAPSAAPKRQPTRAAGLPLAPALALAFLLLLSPAPASAAAGQALQTHDVEAVGATWSPESPAIELGDEVRWNFPAETAVFPHDVWLVPPGGDPSPTEGDIFELTDGIVFPGGEPVSHVFDQEGTWLFVCRVHSGFSGGQWSGQVGTVAVGTVDETEFEPYERPDPALPDVPPGAVKQFTVDVYEHVTKVAANLPPTRVWSFGVNGRLNRGTGVSEPIVVNQGDEVEITLRNGSSEEMDVTMPHSIDLHAARVAPDQGFRTIQPGETHTFSFTARHPGVFMYHCGTAPILHHVGSGMAGMIVVKPTGLEPVDRELWLVQQEYYLGEPGGIADLGKMLDLQPDVIAFNGYANQYANEPIEVRSQERIRMYVLNAGPSAWSAFHVIGTVFDRTVTDNGVARDVQTVNLAPSQGGYLELSLDEPGDYPFVNHSFGNMVKGSLGVLAAAEGSAELRAPRLEVRGRPKSRTVSRSRRRARFEFEARNTGDAPTGPMSLCAKAAGRGMAVAGKRCVTRTIGPGGTAKRAVRVRIRPRARGTAAQVRLIAKGAKVQRQATSVRLRVRSGPARRAAAGAASLGDPPHADAH
ncbi:MAG TPA: multicopper oxidase domain-containing protein [Solirubrobacterales bacterium]|nr:multicopper oxidase domain-containing protein [Solirubrobacterales bacterium]